MGTLLEELIGPDYDKMSDEELDKLIMDGRTAREVTEGTAKGKRKAAEPKEPKMRHTAEDLADFE